MSTISKSENTRDAKMIKMEPFFDFYIFILFLPTIFPTFLVLPVSEVTICWPFYFSSLPNSKQKFPDLFEGPKRL